MSKSNKGKSAAEHAKVNGVINLNGLKNADERSLLERLLKAIMTILAYFKMPFGFIAYLGENEVDDLKPAPWNPAGRMTVSIIELAESIRSFGFISLIVVDKYGTIISGHRRWQACRELKRMYGLDSLRIPVLVRPDVDGAKLFAEENVRARKHSSWMRMDTWLKNPHAVNAKTRIEFENARDHVGMATLRYIHKHKGSIYTYRAAVQIAQYVRVNHDNIAFLKMCIAWQLKFAMTDDARKWMKASKGEFKRNKLRSFIDNDEKICWCD